MRGYLRSMRLAASLAVLFLAAASQADRLITVPTARKIPIGTVRYEFRLDPASNGFRENLLGIGINTFMDMEIRNESGGGRPDALTFDLSYNVIAPLPGLTPGLSFGVQDALDKTPDGRRFYGAFTSRETFTTANGDYPADITLGIIGGKVVTPFVGVLLPFSQEFHILAEHNGLRISAGAEYRVRPWLNLRAQVQGRIPQYGAQVTWKF